MVVPQFTYPFTYWMTSWLLPNFGIYKWSCYKHPGFCVDLSFQILRVHTKECDCWIFHMVRLCFVSYETTQLSSKNPVPFYIPTSNEWVSDFLKIKLLSIYGHVNSKGDKEIAKGRKGTKNDKGSPVKYVTSLLI